MIRWCKVRSGRNTWEIIVDCRTPKSMAKNIGDDMRDPKSSHNWKREFRFVSCRFEPRNITLTSDGNGGRACWQSWGHVWSCLHTLFFWGTLSPLCLKFLCHMCSNSQQKWAVLGRVQNWNQGQVSHRKTMFLNAYRSSVLFVAVRRMSEEMPSCRIKHGGNEADRRWAWENWCLYSLIGRWS